MKEGPSEDEAIVGYQWTCPQCGTTKTGLVHDDEQPHSKAVGSLATHVRTTAGGGHGPSGQYPGSFDPDGDELAEHVEFWTE